MKFVKAAKVHEFDTKRFKRLNIMARKLAVFKDGDNAFFATEVSCKHQNWDLTTGPLEGDILTCPRHHWKYNIRTGQCLNHDSTPLRRYAVKVEGDDVLVSLHPLEENPLDN
jgi:nitrite reductase/ring-hydroxylating ferredoxin subunit